MLLNASGIWPMSFAIGGMGKKSWCSDCAGSQGLQGAGGCLPQCGIHIPFSGLELSFCTLGKIAAVSHRGVMGIDTFETD